MILETERVLRGAYQIERARVNAAIRALLSLDRIITEDESSLFAALDSHAEGMDFADALHLASSQRADSFATFDSSFKTRARILSLLRPVTRL